MLNAKSELAGLYIPFAFVANKSPFGNGGGKGDSVPALERNQSRAKSACILEIG
jgi:hypothetical protein